MSLPTNPSIYAAIAIFFVISLVAARVPWVRRIVSTSFSLGAIALVTILIVEQGRFNPTIAPLLERLTLDRQTVMGDEVRVTMHPDGHFWVRAAVGAVERRMLVDTGATVTAISTATASAAGAAIRDGLTPVMMQTANGPTLARTATLDTLRIGDIEARELPVVVSPALGRVDVLGMNFLMQLKSWRVEGRTLILVPRRPAPPPPA